MPPITYEYKVVRVTPHPPMTATSSVEARQIEEELNKWGREGWEFYTMREQTTEEIQEISVTPHRSFRIPTLIGVTLIFRKVVDRSATGTRV